MEVFMKTYQYNVYTKETFNATGKAKGDIIQILDSLGINNLYSPSSHRAVRIVQQIIATTKLRGQNNSVLIIQYPAVIDSFIDRVANHCRLIGIIHDLQSIRGDKSVQDEIRVLNQFDVLISHNSLMSNYLREKGCKSKIIDLEIFDYLTDGLNETKVDFSKKRVAFAGNLDKSEFVKKLFTIKDVNFRLYGLIQDKKTLHDVKYAGVLPSDEIVNQLEGEFGLIWDGDEITTCAGTLGNYLRFNNPHKLSLYLAAGKPVIVWKNAAVARFVEDNQVGITINSLNELPKLLNQLTESQFSQLRANVKRVRARLIKGEYTKTAIKSALQTEEK
ncbi:galactofuranosyltransferase [Lactiplantibacillus plantarum]